MSQMRVYNNTVLGDLIDTGAVMDAQRLEGISPDQNCSQPELMGGQQQASMADRERQRRDLREKQFKNRMDRLHKDVERRIQQSTVSLCTLTVWISCELADYVTRGTLCHVSHVARDRGPRRKSGSSSFKSSSSRTSRSGTNSRWCVEEHRQSARCALFARSAVCLRGPQKY